MPDPAPNSPTRKARPRLAADVMTPGPRTCSPQSSVLEAVMIFRDEDCGAVPIIDAGKAVGILTDRDVALALAEHPDLATRAVADVMSEGVITVKTTAPVGEVEAIFGREGIRRVVVTDDSDQVVGIIAWSDITPVETDREVGEFVSDVVEQP